ncbi:translation initiation factor 3 subunit J component [Zygosaccharomyces mellis]|uniref:Eukaryotic translation initiation factor 3 subunit J n=1 Tax=Zygosaccharomyces mellis TaxID=42258 RepID=A0A4C2E9B7_9SACH|nr:translation initiation factor 3 subunit J component [Zygosaccharomyces mellis]
MSWDDDVIGGSATNGDDAVLMESWEDGLNDEPVLDSWDKDETEEKKPPTSSEDSKKSAADKSTASNKKKNGSKKEKESSNTPKLAIDELDPRTRQELMKKAELESDLKNASDLLGDLDLAGEHPKAQATKKREEEELFAKLATPLTKDTPISDHPLIQKAETKKDYQDLRKSLASAITPLNERSSLNYSSSLAIDLVRDISKPMSIESIRQTVATLNILIKDKERQERQARLSKVKGGTATGGAGKKKAKAKTNLGGSFKKDQEFDIGGDLDLGDFNDDDFM